MKKNIENLKFSNLTEQFKRIVKQLSAFMSRVA